MLEFPANSRDGSEDRDESLPRLPRQRLDSSGQLLSLQVRAGQMERQ